MNQILLEFLNMPLDRGDAILERFAALPGASFQQGPKPLQRYVYLPGTRKDRVVLVAHVDTVWDKAYNHPFSEEREALPEADILRSSHPNCGIGADCRAGCAMLWQLRNSGHSLLLVDGEEYGKHGAKYLRQSNRRLFQALNCHQYMIELDYQGTDCCLFNQVDNTKKFKYYIERVLGFADAHAKGGCDLQVLCRRICGVNLGIGYHRCHTSKEFLVLSEWENTLQKLEVFLQKPQPRFPSLLFPPYIRLIKICINKVLRTLRIKK